MHLLLTISAIVFCSCVSIRAQDSTVQSETRHIVILNKKYEPFKEINIGDEVRLILTNSTRVKGHITSIDSTFFTVDNNVVHLDEIGKISMKKRTVQFILGGALIAGGIASFYASSNDDARNAKGGYGLLGLVLTGVGVGLVVPAYPNPKIGKSKFLLISNKPNDL